MSQTKQAQTEKLRQVILSSVRNISETDRAEASLCDLSFQSTIYPNKHVWIDMYRQHIEIDLEDWDSVIDAWDNTVEHYEDVSVEETIRIIDRWVNNVSNK